MQRGFMEVESSFRVQNPQTPTSASSSDSSAAPDGTLRIGRRAAAGCSAATQNAAARPPPALFLRAPEAVSSCRTPGSAR